MNIKQYKQQLLDELYEPYKQCLLCPLGSLGKTTVVFGQGNPDARLMFIGEGPGRDEDMQGLPFVGRSGKLLNKVLDLHNTTRDDIFITNVVKCRPPNNRKPAPQEAHQCKTHLLYKQIQIIRPRILCTLGSSATQALLNKDIKITKMRGIPVEHSGITIIPTYHPAYILRNHTKLEVFSSDIQKAINFSQKK